MHANSAAHPDSVGPVDALLFMPWSARAAGDLAGELRCPAYEVACHRFPDGETCVRLPVGMPPRVALFASLDDPDARLTQLMLAADAARELGAREVVLVAPYLCYMRQDVAFNPGEAVSQRIVGRHLARLFEAVVTVDPHLHRVARLDEAIPDCDAVALTAAAEIGQLAVGRIAQSGGGAPLLIGPDAESARWVEAAALAGSLEFAVCEKQRTGDHNVGISLPQVDFAGRAVVIVDDVASTGNTLAEAARAIFDAGAASVDVAVTHALFVDDAIVRLRDAGVRHVWSADSIAHPTNAIRLAPLLAAALA